MDDAGVMAGITEAGIRRRRGLRIALLSLAVTILLLGAAIAGIFCYRAISDGQPATAAPHPRAVMSLGKTHGVGGITPQTP